VEKNKKWYTSVCGIEELQSHSCNPGAWINDPPLADLASSSDRSPLTKAKVQRFHLIQYFISDEGMLPWQGHMI